MTTSPATRRQRIADVLGGVRRSRELAAHDAWSREQLEAHQRERLRELVAFAVQRSPFHRARLAGGALPTMDKAALLEHYDAIVTDPRLTLARLEEHLAALDDDLLLHGDYRIMGTGGTSGRRTIIPWARAEWREVVASYFRFSAMAGRRPRPGRRMASITTRSPRHMTARAGLTLDVGVMRMLRLYAAQPLDELAAALQAHRPDELIGYPSVLALLADAQLDGRLRVAPSFVTTSSEVCTPDMAARIQEAWGVAPMDCLGITEAGITAVTCPERAGMHVFEDQVMVEVLDEDHRPAPDGEPGRLVVTPLGLRTLPLVRYEMGDLVRATREPCACGRPSLRLLEVQGRADDVLRLPGAAGGTIAVHPIVLRSPLAAVAGLAQYQVVCAPERLRVCVTLRAGADETAVSDDVRRRIGAALAGAGARVPELEVAVSPTLPRSEIGKHRLVVMA
ncbi:MAG: phenylacetate--CoA ligase family protein [Solirubrobacterales bacterium]|nr:phenylacetate--CoA ligase family protein [Solirubrobacterales bacterium]